MAKRVSREQDGWQWHKKWVGRKFRRRKGGRQQTRLVVDTTFGFGIWYRYGPKLCYEAYAERKDWEAWVMEAKEIK